MDAILDHATLPSEAFNRLTCSKCKKPLSRFPIYTHLKFQHYVCGRCVTDLTDLSDYTRSVAYEQIAEYIRFDCCNKMYGCLRVLFPTKMKDHEEKYCNYMKYNCALGRALCSWYGFHNEHLDHFQKNHEDFLLNSKQLTIDFNNSYEQKYLLANGEELFVVKIQNCLTFRKFSCVVCCIRKSFNTENLYCKLEFSDLNAKFTLQILQKVNEIYEVSDNALSRTFCNNGIIQLRILHIMEILNEKDKDKENVDNVNMEKPYECPVCLESFLPPIYQCVAGHSICERCENTLEICPLCKQNIGNTRNFALEDIVLNKSMLCKNSNCAFTGKGSDVKKHQELCGSRVVFCFFSDHYNKELVCNDSMKFSEIHDHVVSKHNSCLLKFDEESRSFIITEIGAIYLLKYMSKLFRLVVEPHEEQETICWSLQLTGNNELCKQFKFVVNITIGENSRCLEGPCIPVQTGEEYFKNPKNFINSYVSYEDRDILCYPYSVTILDREN